MTKPQSPGTSTPVPWRMSHRGVAVRLFITCWLVYGFFFATDVVREHYLAIAIGDRFSFRVDEYQGLHPDLFEKNGYGWHIGNNPGASIFAAVPYALFRPAIDLISERTRRARMARDPSEPPAYETEWPRARAFYAEAWRRGMDVKVGLAAFVTHAFFMAPLSALAVVMLFLVLRWVFGSDRTAFWLALLYAFGTPVFLRTGILNQNMLLGHAAFFGFALLWNPMRWSWSWERRAIVAGLSAGLCVLLDYSGIVALVGLLLYAVLKRRREASSRDSLRAASFFVLGMLGPILLLWFYQWTSFGHPFLPPQHWMPPVRWIEQGYQGYGLPQLELLLALVADHRFGVFASCPLFLLALAYPFLRGRLRWDLPAMEAVLGLLIVVGFWVFFSGSNYTRLQYNTGIRYMAPTFPFLFLYSAVVLVRLPPLGAYFVSILSLLVGISLAMVREVERALGVLDPLLRTLIGGFTLPALRTLSSMEEFAPLVGRQVSPLPLFALAAAILYGVWAIPWRRSEHHEPGHEP